MDKEKEAVENAARKHIEFIKSRGEKGLSVIKSLAIFEDMEKDEDSGDERKEEKNKGATELDTLMGKDKN